MGANAQINKRQIIHKVCANGSILSRSILNTLLWFGDTGHSDFTLPIGCLIPNQTKQQYATDHH